MQINPLAADSLGTRSSATFVETDDVKILIDPSAALGPYRHGKGPHAKEYERLNEHWEIIRKHAKKADILVVTHYHYDHHNPEEPGIFKGKVLFTKHPKENINKSQIARSSYFLKKLEGIPAQIVFSDGAQRKIGKTTIEFSPAVFHGTNNKLGYVTEVCVKEGKETYVQTSDIEGPAVDHQHDFLMRQKPTVAYIDGPMTYMLGYRYSQQSLDVSLNNLKQLIEKAKTRTLIMEHHLLRDIKWEERIAPLVEFAKTKGTTITTAAQYAGKEIDQLEANRTKLWKEFPNMKPPASNVPQEA